VQSSLSPGCLPGCQEGQVRRLLGFRTRMQVHTFLKAHNVYLDYSIRELENDLASLKHFEETLTE
jgi:Uncharacterised protein family (UPF0175)